MPRKSKVGKKKAPKVPCPKCGKPSTPNAQGPKVVHCKSCGGFVSVDPDEGGDYYTDPAKRMGQGVF